MDYSIEKQETGSGTQAGLKVDWKAQQPTVTFKTNQSRSGTSVSQQITVKAVTLTQFSS